MWIVIEMIMLATPLFWLENYIKEYQRGIIIPLTYLFRCFNSLKEDTIIALKVGGALKLL